MFEEALAIGNPDEAALRQYLNTIDSVNNK
jgi:hypothetical protein